MGTFRVGIKIEIKIIQYVYVYIISHMNMINNYKYLGFAVGTCI